MKGLDSILDGSHEAAYSLAGKVFDILLACIRATFARHGYCKGGPRKFRGPVRDFRHHLCVRRHTQLRTLKYRPRISCGTL
jgi:hypothetical protein